MAPATTTHGLADVFEGRRGLRIAIDLAGLAIAGGLFIVPSFSAVQAWAGADRRARVIAGNNVLNAAFMVVGRSCRLAQQFGVSTPALFIVSAAPSCRRGPHRPHHAGELDA